MTWLWQGPRERKNFFVALAFLLPNLLGFLAFTAGPVLLSLYMSFTNWNLKPAVTLQWIGLRNYVDLFSDPYFWFYFYNTLYFMLGIPFTVAGSLFLANMLASPMKVRTTRFRLKFAVLVGIVGVFTCILLFASGRKDAALLLGILYGVAAFGVLWGSMTYRTLFYVPSFASGVATIILWTQVYNPYHGLANNLIQYVYTFLGIDADLPMWLTSTKSLLGFIPWPEVFSNGGFGLGAREAIMIMATWMGVGGHTMILYIAAISNIPEDLYEAAQIDGAGAVGKFRHITLPQVAPTTFFITVMAIIRGLQGGFNFAKIMTNGGPAGTTTTLAYYIYTAGFEELRFGYASSVAWVMFVVIFGMTLVNWRYGNRRINF